MDLNTGIMGYPLNKSISDLLPSKRSNSGYKTIKVTDKACFSYEGE